MASTPSSSHDGREPILAAAESLLALSGPGSLSVVAVASHAQLSESAVCDAFCNDQELVAALIARRYVSVLQAMRAAAREPGTIAARLDNVLVARVQAFMQFESTLPDAYRIWAAASAGVRVAIDEFRRDELALLASLLDQGTRTGDFGLQNIALSADALQLALVGLSPPELYRRRPAAALGAAHALADLFLQGLLARRRPSSPPPPSDRRRRFSSR